MLVERNSMGLVWPTLGWYLVYSLVLVPQASKAIENMKNMENQ